MSEEGAEAGALPAGTECYNIGSGCKDFTVEKRPILTPALPLKPVRTASHLLIFSFRRASVQLTGKGTTSPQLGQMCS